MTTVSLRPDARMARIQFSNGTLADFPFLWLKDNDPAGFHPDTGERAFELTSIPADLTAQSARIGDETLVVTWGGDLDDTHLSLEWLFAHRPGQRRPDPAMVPPALWRAGHDVQRVAAEDISRSDAGLLDWLRTTLETGLSVVEGLADLPDAGVDLAKRIGHLRETNFGLTFDVRSKPNPNNLAYTSDALPLHTDLTNQELPPGFQFLHCLANEAIGGGSEFCDGFAVAEDLRQRDPDSFDILSRVSVPFRFHDAQTDIRSRKRVITLDDQGAVTEICFNAHIADIPDLPADDLAAFYSAYRQFMVLSRDPGLQVSFALAPGEMVAFDNRRVLHGRGAFDPSTGYRHLRGCYVDRGEFLSKIRVLSRA